jgi:hypothetical protein
MSNWKDWYSSFTESKRQNELKAFAAGLRGEKYEPEKVAKFDSTSSWSELLSVLRDFNDYSDLNFNYKDGNLSSDNKLINVCFEKALKTNTNYHSPEILKYLIFNYLKSIIIPDVLSFVKVIREIPEEVFLECNNCGFYNPEGWSICDRCKINIENSYELDFP